MHQASKAETDALTHETEMRRRYALRQPRDGGVEATATSMGYVSGNRTLRTRDSSALRHFGTVHMGPNISAPVLKCPKDTSDLSAELSSPVVQTVPPYGRECPTLWSEVSRPNFVVCVALNKECHLCSLLSRNLHHSLAHMTTSETQLCWS